MPFLNAALTTQDGDKPVEMQSQGKSTAHDLSTEYELELFSPIPSLKSPTNQLSVFKVAVTVQET